METNDTNLKSEVAKREEETLKFWRENQIFEKSLKQTEGKPDFVFYDGPPFATGLPHYGHILASAIKDAVPRYQTMRGYHVSRCWGWDCHGLPIENIVEKELKISGKKEIEKLGVAKFNEVARSKVFAYVEDWKKTVERIGRWVDFDGSYKTMDNTYMESVWWALAEMNKKGLLYEGTRVLPYCPRCETPIANAEIAMDNSYKDISDLSVFVKFELVDEPGTYFLAWTTTPWTLPGNTALAVNPDTNYVRIKANDTNLILAESRLAVLKDVKYEIVETFSGKDLVGKRYKTLFDYYLKEGKVYGADFVTTEDGTGIVHIAPAFGEDDMKLAQKENLPVVIHVDSTGHFKPEVTAFAGMAVKPKSDDEKTRMAADIEVIRYLQSPERNLFFAKQKITHAYPHCMRCETPLYYYAIPAWFVKIQELKPRLQELNQEISWVPEHLKFGRFAKSMEGAPDWTISRNRFWATPLPIWKCEKCKEFKVVGSLKELLAEREPRNHYVVMRHGEAETNRRNILSSDPNAPFHLTEQGKIDALDTAKFLVKNNFDLIITSPFFRTKETTEIVRQTIGLDSSNVLVDARLSELGFGIRDGKDFASFMEAFPEGPLSNRFNPNSDGVETYAELKKRMGDFLYDIESRYEGKNILIVSHGSPIMMLIAAARGLDRKQSLELEAAEYVKKAESRKLDFRVLPRNSEYELDLHRPYIDEVKFKCDCGGEMKRIPEVIDCWFESGSMPFASEHYPFENVEKTEKRLPADFVAEYIAQTRTWFYYMHTISTILWDKIPFRNVVTTGNVLAEDGQKMSKSKQNFPDPWLVFNQYGVDALRFYLLSSPIMKAEDLSFSERGLGETYRRVIARLRNVLSFYEMYADKNAPARMPAGDVLDSWILSRLQEANQAVTQAMESYEVDKALRPIDDFVDDFSTWYLRRSRERFKAEEASEREQVAATMRYVLVEFSKLIAPFVPFVAEEIFQVVKSENDPESVHLEEWPEAGAVDKNILEQMAKVRELVSIGLEMRSKTGIKIRQPLASFVINAELPKEFLDLIKDELNVEEVEVGKDFALDTRITPELKEKGEVRELIREIQDWRKKQDLKPGEKVAVPIPGSKKELAEKFAAQIKSATAASGFEFVS